MQTLQFARGLQRVVTELKAKAIILFLQPLVIPGSNQNITSGQKDAFGTLMVQSIEGLANLKSDPITRQIVEILKLPEVYAAPRIGKIWSLLNNATQAANLWSNQESTGELFRFLGMLQCLDNLASGTATLLEAERLSKRPPDTHIVEFEIVDDSASGVDAERVKRFFEILIELHSQLAHFLNENKGSFRVAYLDSGSAVVGAAVTVGIAERLKTLITEVWKAIKYEPFDTFDRKLESVTKALTITKEIDAQVQSGALKENDAKALTLQIVGQAVELIKIGAIIPAPNEADDREQRKLLEERRIKLLGSGESPAVGAQNPEK